MPGVSEDFDPVAPGQREGEESFSNKGAANARIKSSGPDLETEAEPPLRTVSSVRPPPKWKNPFKKPLSVLPLELARKLSYASLLSVFIFGVALIVAGLLAWTYGSDVQDELRKAPKVFCSTRVPDPNNSTTASLADESCYPNRYDIPDNTAPFWISSIVGGVNVLLVCFGVFCCKNRNPSALLVYISLDLIVSLVVLLLSVQMFVTMSCIEHTNSAHLNAACKTYFRGLLEIKPLPSFLQDDGPKWDSIMQKVFTDSASREAVDWKLATACGNGPPTAEDALVCAEEAIAQHIKAPASFCIFSVMSGLAAAFFMGCLRQQTINELKEA